jgi:hypothetical protein
MAVVIIKELFRIRRNRMELSTDIEENLVQSALHQTEYMCTCV